MNWSKILVDNKGEFKKRLRTWYLENHRKLPWRENPSPYKTVVSEFMLQQTQVETVLPYFKRWLKIFPDFEALAQAKEEEVVKQWEGLGYYSRARNLHKLAKAVSVLKELPTTAEGWQQFPGVGPYTAAAVASISFGDKTAVVDGNVIRILARLSANGEEFQDNTKAVKAFTPLANDLLNEEDPDSHNQAMMELGATVCSRQKPLCTVCPVVALCAAAKIGEPERFPRFKKRTIQKIEKERVWLTEKSTLLLHQIPSHAKRLAKMYELPEATHINYRAQDKDFWKTKRRGISNQRIEEHIYKLDKPAPKMKSAIESNPELSWVNFKDLKTLTLSGPHRKWINEMIEHDLKASQGILEN